MQNTTNYNLKKPDYTDFADVQDINDNMDTIDAELANLTGDAANAKVGSSTASTASYPVPAANDTFKVILGKIIKFFSDIKAAYTNVSVSGKTVTFTTAAGGTKQITTQDTTYSDFTKATASAAGAHGLVPAPAAGKQGQFLRGDATWATPTDTTYTAGTGLSLSSNKFNHSNAVTAGTAGQSSASSGRNTLAVPYVTYDAQGHVTAAGTHTHTINNVSGASSTANGGAGLVPAPQAGHYTDRALIFLRNDGSWAFLPLQNNSTTTAEHYALDARMGKTLNDKINSIVLEDVSLSLTGLSFSANGFYTASKAYTVPSGKAFIGVVMVITTGNASILSSNGYYNSTEKKLYATLNSSKDTALSNQGCTVVWRIMLRTA